MTSYFPNTVEAPSVYGISFSKYVVPPQEMGLQCGVAVENGLQDKRKCAMLPNELTLRDFFASTALIGLLAGGFDAADVRVAVARAFDYAEAMVEGRSEDRNENGHKVKFL